MIKGILFDKDGTLIDFYEVWGTAAGSVAEKLCSHWNIPERQQLFLQSLGIKDGIVDAKGAFAWMPYQGIAGVLLENLWKEGENKPSLKELTKEISRLFYEETAEKRTDYPVFADMDVLLMFLKQKGIQIGMATTDTLASAKKCMEVLGVEEYFTFWGASGAGLPEKPQGELIQMAAERWGIRPDEIAVVGDTPNDMEFARNGGAMAIAVRSGTGTEEELRPMADYILYSVADLAGFIEENDKEKKDGTD